MALLRRSNRCRREAPAVIVAPVPKACGTPRLVIASRVEIKSWPERSAPATISITIDNCTDVAWEPQWAHLLGGKDDLVDVEKPIAGGSKR